MKFNPITNILYTDNNKVIKKMYCPYPSLRWDELSSVEGSLDRNCSLCEKNVIETKDMNDEMLCKLIQEEPESCLKIDFNQENIRIVHHV